MTGTTPARHSSADIDSAYAWMRLGISFVIVTIGGIGMWSFVVALPAVQAEFNVPRGSASLPFTLTMAGFALGGVMMGRAADRFGIMVPSIFGALLLCFGYLASSYASNLWLFAIAQGVIGLGCSASFGPMMSEVSHWFTRRRGIAVAVASSGNYLAGTIWPTIVEHFVARDGWRFTQMAIGIACLITMVPLSLLLRRPAPVHAAAAAGLSASHKRGSLGISSNALMFLLCVAGVGCCVAMAMPQVHIVAYCGDLGYGPARGAQMLSLMMAFGIISRLTGGVVADRVGGLATMLIGSVLQGVALFLYLWFDGLTSLYIISALFGLFQGALVPMYAIVVREYFSPQEAGTRVGIVLMATLMGMALGGWLSGVIYDFTGAYRAAFFNGLLWNLLNVMIVLWLLRRSRQRMAYA